MQTKLDHLFDELNTRFFAGRLPKYLVRKRRMFYKSEGRCDDSGQVIWIGKTADHRATLLHEMCHVGIVELNHRRAFRARLRRLEKLGEGWAREERKRWLADEHGFDTIEEVMENRQDRWIWAEVLQAAALSGRSKTEENPS